MVDRIRSLLAHCPEDEDIVRDLIASDPEFDALCEEYREAVDELGSFDVRIKFLKERRAWLEEKLLTRIEGLPE